MLEYNSNRGSDRQYRDSKIRKMREMRIHTRKAFECITRENVAKLAKQLSLSDIKLRENAKRDDIAFQQSNVKLDVIYNTL